MAAACAAAVRGTASARRIPVEVETLGVRLAPRAHPVRLAPREGSRLVLDRTLELALHSPAAAGPRLDGVLRSKDGASVAATVDALVPGCRTLAALLAQLGQRPRWRWRRSLALLRSRARATPRRFAAGWPR